MNQLKETQIKQTFYRKYGKRILDFILSVTALAILSPFLLLIALMVKMNLGSPVIFKQKRPGLNEKMFTIYKFRTMTNQKDKRGNLLSDAVRLTSFGKFLRSTSMDELPELWNIAYGDMSIVGPRPLLKRYLLYFTNCEKHRHAVKPGLTGLAQINGRNNLDWTSRLSIDVKYMLEFDFKVDILIIICTVYNVLLKNDISMGNDLKMLDLDVERIKYCEIKNSL